MNQLLRRTRRETINPFFIDEIPESARYADHHCFFPNQDRKVLLSRIQMVDTAFSEEEFVRVSNTEPDPKFAREFAIKIFNPQLKQEIFYVVFVYFAKNQARANRHFQHI